MGHLRVLVFSATFGAGHVRAAEALIEAVRKEKPEAEVIHVDFGAYVSKTINKLIKNTYIDLIKYTPKLWGKLYYRTSKIKQDSLISRIIKGLGRREFLDYVNEISPDVIICTYPTIACILGELRLEGILNSPVVTVVTDYTVHNHWIHTGVDLYIVGNNDVFQYLSKSGIDPERIKITGIPVSLSFEEELDREKLAESFNLDPNYPTFLVMGGAYGVLGGIKGVCKILAESEIKVQTLVVCGRDEKLYRSLDSVAAEAKNPFLRFGFVNNVEEFMTVSDVIITKAGGLTVSEALTKHLPLIIYKPIPGQEEKNALFVKRIGAGEIAETDEEIEKIVNHLLKNPHIIDSMRSAAASAIPGHAAERAVSHIFSLLG